MLRSTILLLRLNHTLKFRHGFLHDTIQPMELDSFVSIISQDNNKVLRDKRNKTINFHRLERSMEEYVSTFQSVVDMEQQNGGPQKK